MPDFVIMGNNVRVYKVSRQPGAQEAICLEPVFPAGTLYQPGDDEAVFVINNGKPAIAYYKGRSYHPPVGEEICAKCASPLHTPLSECTVCEAEFDDVWGDSMFSDENYYNPFPRLWGDGV
jgi:hypothetical protein